MIVLTLEEAETVLGPSPADPESALEPVPLADGTYGLSEDILDDPANADVRAFLSERVVPGGLTPEQTWDFGTEEEPDLEAINDYNAAQLTWHEGGAQRAAAAKSAKRKRR